MEEINNHLLESSPPSDTKIPNAQLEVRKFKFPAPVSKDKKDDFVRRVDELRATGMTVEAACAKEHGTASQYYDYRKREQKRTYVRKRPALENPYVEFKFEEKDFTRPVQMDKAEKPTEVEPAKPKDEQLVIIMGDSQKVAATLDRLNLLLGKARA